MKIRLVVGVAAALALTACGGQNKPAAVSAETSAAVSSQATASPATAAATAAKGEKPPREFLIGKWGTNGDCTMAIDLRPDGTSDGPFGNWAYGDGVISFPEEPAFKVNVTVIDNSTMESTNATSDKASQMTRCP